MHTGTTATAAGAASPSPELIRRYSGGAPRTTIVRPSIAAWPTSDSPSSNRSGTPSDGRP